MPHLNRSPNKDDVTITEQAYREALGRPEEQAIQIPVPKSLPVKRATTRPELVRRPAASVKMTHGARLNNRVVSMKQNAESIQVSSSLKEIAKKRKMEAATERPAAEPVSTSRIEIPGKLFSSIVTAERMTDKDEELFQSNPELSPIAAQQVPIETMIPSSLETPDLLELEAVNGFDAVPSTETLTFGYEDDLLALEEFLIRPEAIRLQVDAEYVGELLRSALVDILGDGCQVEVDIEAEEGAGLFLDEAATMEGDTGNVTAQAEDGTIDKHDTELYFYLESLAPQQVAVIKRVFKEISDVLEENQQLLPEKATDQNGILELKLEELSVVLFEQLGVVYDQETIRQFMRCVLRQDTYSNVEFKKQELVIEARNKMGTREYKISDGLYLIGSLVRLIKRKVPAHLTIGRYALLGLQPSF